MDAGGPVMYERSWRWLSVRIVQLLTDKTTRMHRAIYPEKDGGR